MDFKRLKEPFVIILIGPPLSGKSTFVRNNFPDTEVISRDEILMEVWGNRNYDEAFANVNQREVDKVLHSRMVAANEQHKNVIIDMTHMTSKRRRVNLEYFSDDYFKLAIIFPILEEQEYERRNAKRMIEENKNLPMHIIKRMISQYQPISEDEGFDRVYSL
jgi:predicted kinase